MIQMLKSVISIFLVHCLCVPKFKLENSNREIQKKNAHNMVTNLKDESESAKNKI